METSLKTGFAQIFSRCPKNLSCPKFGGAAYAFSTSYKPVHSVMSKTDEETKQNKKSDFEYFTYTTSIAIVHNLLKSGNKPRARCISIPE